MGTLLRMEKNHVAESNAIDFFVIRNGPDHHFDVDDVGQMCMKKFSDSYKLRKDCIECGKSRIRYKDCDRLAFDGKCWSCYED